MTRVLHSTSDEFLERPELIKPTLDLFREQISLGRSVYLYFALGPLNGSYLATLSDERGNRATMLFPVMWLKENGSFLDITNYGALRKVDVWELVDGVLRLNSDSTQDDTCMVVRSDQACTSRTVIHDFLMKLTSNLDAFLKYHNAFKEEEDTQEDRIISYRRIEGIVI